MRTPLIAGNWKMHGSLHQAKTLITEIKNNTHSLTGIEIALLPSFLHLDIARQQLSNTHISYGAQNLYLGEQGAFTGEVSGPMLKDMGCKYVLVGHSERRMFFNEGLDLVAAKFKAALAADLIPVLCIGESQEQRQLGDTNRLIQKQLESVLEVAGIESFTKAVIAYEPIWAIGTGVTATPQQAQEVHHFIREMFTQINVDIAKTIRILYGGSMKAENAASLLTMPDIDGGLIGGASLQANSFGTICAAASQVLHPAH